MDHTLTINDEIFSRIQKFAVPLVDTLETALLKVLAAAEGNIAGAPSSHTHKERDFNPATAPDLSFTTILSINVGGNTLPPSWNTAMRRCIEIVASTGLDNRSIRQILVTKAKIGQIADPSYTHIPSVDISVQGVDANNAWKNIFRLTKEAKLAVQVEFVWQDKPGAANPGVIGRMKMGEID